MPNTSGFPKAWKDEPSTETPITAAELIRIETGVLAGIRPPVTALGAGLTLGLANEGEVLAISAAGAVNVTVPNDSTVNFPVGATVQVAQIGAGLITAVGASGVTLNTTSGLNTIRQYGVLTLVKRAANTWLVIPPTRPIWVGTEAQFVALGTKDPATLYLRTP